MKHLPLFLFLFLIFLPNFAFSTTEVGRLDKKIISQCAHAIETKIKTDRYKLAVVMCLGVGMQFLALQKILQGSLLREASQQAKPLIERGSFSQELFNSAQQIIARVQHMFFTADGLWGVTAFVGKVFGEMGLYIISQKTMASLMYPDTLYWYVTSCVPCIKTVSVMKETAKQLSSGTVHEIQKKHYPQLLIDGCNQLVFYGQHICAYMCYKSTQLPEIQKMMAIREASYIFSFHNRWLKNMSDQLSMEQPDYAMVLELIDSYQVEIKRHLQYFEAIETVEV